MKIYLTITEGNHIREAYVDKEVADTWIKEWSSETSVVASVKEVELNITINELLKLLYSKSYEKTNAILCEDTE